MGHGHCDGLTGKVLRVGPIANALGKCLGCIVGVGHGKGLRRLISIHPSRQHLQRRELSGRQGEGRSVHGIGGIGRSQVERNAIECLGRSQQVRRVRAAAAIQTAAGEGGAVGHDGRGQVKCRSEIDGRVGWFT